MTRPHIDILDVRDADDLMAWAIQDISDGRTDLQMTHNLAEIGIEELEAREIIKSARNVFGQFRKQARRKSGLKNIGIGIGVALLGGIGTFASFYFFVNMNFPIGIFFWGAIVVGALQAIFGLLLLIWGIIG